MKPSKRNSPISFKPKIAIAKFIGKMQKKSGIMKSGLDAMPLFLLDDLLKYPGIFEEAKKLTLDLFFKENYPNDHFTLTIKAKPSIQTYFNLIIYRFITKVIVSYLHHLIKT